MSRAIWKGSISFGLVNIPVGLHSAEERDEISFNLLDRRNMARVRYKRANDKTGEEVPWDEIVKGYEYEEDQFVVLSDKVIVVNLLRYAHEIRNAEKLDVPKESLKELDIHEKEIELGERLVEAMVQPWKPEKYQDTYRADLLKLIDKKIKSGATQAITPAEEEEVEEPKRQARILDMTELLKRSVEKAQKRGPQKAARAPERRRKVA